MQEMPCIIYLQQQTPDEYQYCPADIFRVSRA